MFQALKNFFLRRNAPPCSPETEEEAAQRFAENPHFVTDPNQIFRILRNLQKEELLLTATLPHVAEKFSTTLLKVHGSSGYVVLDELTPETGHMWLLEKKQLTIHAFVKGVPVSFKLDDIQTGRDNGIAYYTASLPRQVYYKERRHFRRVAMKIDPPMTFDTVYGTAKIPVHGHVMDMSISGIGILLTDNIARIRRGDSLRKCRIALPDDDEMLFDLVLSYVRNHPYDAEKLFIGGYLDNVEPRSQKHLERFLIGLERSDIRLEKV